MKELPEDYKKRLVKVLKVMNLRATRMNEAIGRGDLVAAEKEGGKLAKITDNESERLRKMKEDNSKQGSK